MSSKKPRRTLPELVIQNQDKATKTSEHIYSSPPVEEPVKLGRGVYRKPVVEDEKKISPMTTTLEALKKVADEVKDQEVALRKRAAIANWREGV